MHDAHHVQKHLHADVREDDHYGLFQVAQVTLSGGEQEIHGPQAEDGEHVAGIDEEGVVRDGDDGRDRVEREHHVGHFHHKQAQEQLEQEFPGKFEFTETRDYFDYIYSRQELAELKGKNFQPKRNHVNKFKRTYNYKYTPLTVDLIPHCLELEEKWCEEHDCEEEESLINERKALNIALRNFDALGLVGGALWVDDEIVGFTYGAPVNHDTFAVHIEKADSRIDGSYNILNQEFARHIPEQYVYLNREEDLGIPGLRKAKLSYRPVILLEKGYAELIES